MSRKPLSCEDVVRQLFAYLDTELDDTTRADIDRHMEQCRECYSRREFEKRLRTKIQESGTEEAPEELYRRLGKILDRY